MKRTLKFRIKKDLVVGENYDGIVLNDMMARPGILKTDVTMDTSLPLPRSMRLENERGGFFFYTLAMLERVK